MIIACHIKKDVTENEFNSAMQVSLSERRKKAEKLITTHKKCVSLAGGMLSFLLSNKYGYKFTNISHSGDYAVCIGENCPCGIDIQKIKEPKESLIKRVCTQKEIHLLKKSENIALDFTKIWCVKEACFKAGMGNSLADFFGENQKIEEQKKKYDIDVWILNEGYAIATCVMK